MADGRFPFLSFLLGLISNLVACFQANLALLIIQADYSRRQQNIVGLLSVPVSRAICVKHAQSGKLFVFKSIYVIRLDGRKRCENATNMCGQGLNFTVVVINKS